MTGESQTQAATRPWRMIVALMLIYMYAFIDRTFIALLVDPIRSTLGVTDVQIGLLLGFGFAFFYCAFNILAGHFADRVNRKSMLLVASLIWGAMTILCGLAGSFLQILVARAGAGAAEGILAPTVYSLMRDAVPPKARALAFSIYGLAPMIGTALALAFGGMLYDRIDKGLYAHVPLLGSLHPWQATLVIVGLCGIPLSLLLLTFSEPRRVNEAPTTAGILGGFSDAVRYMIENRRLYGPLLLFSGTAAMLNFAQNAWLPTAFSRAFNLTPGQVGPALGLMTIASGTIGLLAAGWMMNRASKQDKSVLGYGIAGTIGTSIGISLALASPSLMFAYAFNSIGLLFIGLSFAVGATTLTAITPSDKIGRVSAVYLIFETLAGQTIGPLLVALLSDHVLGGPGSLPVALSVMVLLYAAVASVAALTLRRAMARNPETARPDLSA